MTLSKWMLAALTFLAVTVVAADSDLPCEKCHGEKQIAVKCRTCSGVSKVYEECRTCDAKGILSSKCPTCDGIGLTDTAACAKCAGKGNEEDDCPTCKGSPIRQVNCGSCNGRGQVKDNNEANAMMACNSCSGRGKVEEPCPKCEGKGKVEKMCRVCEGRGITGKTCSKCRGTKVVEKPCPDCKKGIRELPCKTCASKGYQTKSCSVCNGKGATSVKSLFFPWQTLVVADGVISLQKGTGKPAPVANQKPGVGGVFQVLIGTNVMGHYVAGEALKAGEPKVYVTIEKSVKTKPRLDEVKKKWLAFPSVNSALFYLIEK